MQIKYNHKDVEKGKNNIWIKNKIFESKNENDKEPFSIILPPPNITGKLHLGHAWDGALQDILIRYKKMQGYNTVWIPGMDHAGIATQAKIAARLRENGEDINQLGREKFLEKAWEWKDEYSSFIREQWGNMGLALDYSKEKFTLDKDVHDEVYKAFVELYNKGLIYKGARIINWDPEAQTAISDIEVEHKEINGNFYYLKYFIFNSDKQFIEIATTRPETLFGDVAVAVHPDDERYKNLIGKYCINPINQNKIEIIADSVVDMEFGTGAVKITPAHDPNDYEIMMRHRHLKPIIIMNLDGTLNEKTSNFKGLDRFDAREKIIEQLKNDNLLIKIEEHVHNVGHSERTGVIVEPLLSEQWFLKMDELAKKAIKKQEENPIDFFPKRFEKIYLSWLEKIHDWCISRQLWWGHQIPAWYHKKTNEIYVGENEPQDIENWTQETDVLDTWFSSSLWPFVTTKNIENSKFFPTSVLVTGYDIIFFWVSRMIFQSLEIKNTIPFKNVLIHGLVRDENGKKMSKSLGNGIDPMDVIEEYGADALRYFLTTNSTPGQDLRFSKEKIESTWNFINKIWNISRYILSNVEGEKNEYNSIENIDEYLDKQKNLTLADEYILERENNLIQYVIKMMDKYEFTEVSAKLENFIWDDFASKYLESTKVIFKMNNEQQKVNTKIILLKLLEDILKILHPFMPFVTEEIYSNINKNKFIVEKEYPLKRNKKYEINKFTELNDIIVSVRNFRSENDIKNSKKIDIILENITNDYFRDIDLEIIKSLGKVNKIVFNQKTAKETYTKIFPTLILNIITEDLIDKKKLTIKLNNQKEKIESELLRSINILSNDKFLANANEKKVQQEKEKAFKYLNQYQEIVKIFEKEKISVKFHEKIKSIEYVKDILGEL